MNSLTHTEAKQVAMKPILFSTPMVQAILAGRKTQTRRLIKSRYESGMFQVSTAQYEPDVAGYYHNRSVCAVDWDERTIDGGDILCPYGEVGGIVWVRENFKVQEVQRYFDSEWQNNICIDFPASEGTLAVRHWFKMRESERPKVLRRRHPDKVFLSPNIHLPEKCARIFLKITDISVERLQDITEEDAIAEGVEERAHRCGGFGYYQAGGEIQDCYCQKWDNPPIVEGFKDLWESINGPDSWEQDPWIWKLTFERIEKPITDYLKQQ